MQEEIWDRYKNIKEVKHAYGLPAGSIRAVLALLIFGAIWVLLAKHPDIAVPAYLQNLMFIIMGHYFASRNAKDKDPSEPSPLYLPKGSIRTMLVGGFAVTAAVLSYKNQWFVGGSLSQSAIALIVVLGFMLGVIRGHVFKKQRRWLEDIRATVSLTAGVVLVAMVFGLLRIPDFSEISNVQYVATHFRYEEVLAGIVGFYFGSKS